MNHTLTVTVNEAFNAFIDEAAPDFMGKLTPAALTAARVIIRNINLDAPTLVQHTSVDSFIATATQWLSECILGSDTLAQVIVKRFLNWLGVLGTVAVTAISSAVDSAVVTTDVVALVVALVASLVLGAVAYYFVPWQLWLG